MKPVGLAVVGAGYWGNNLARNAQAAPEIALRTVCDTDHDRAARLAHAYGGVGSASSLEQVLDDPDVEAVAVATPAVTHHDVAAQALQAGKHVLVEKPIAASYEDGLAMVAEAEARGLTLMVDHTFCYTPVVQRIREIVREGVLGDVLFVDSVRINLGLVQPDVDVLWDLAPHDLSILDYILPEGFRFFLLLFIGYIIIKDNIAICNLLPNLFNHIVQ